MDPNKLTQKSQEALYEAQNLAVQRGHQEVDAEHLLLALCRQADSLVVRLLEKLKRPADVVIAELGRQLERRPSVSGPGSDPERIFVAQHLNQVFVGADAEAKRLKDEYVSVEHLVLAMLAEQTRTLR